MADRKITDLTLLAAADVAAEDMVACVHVSDTTMAASGTTKRVSLRGLADARIVAATIAQSQVTGLVSGLAGKAAISHTHAASQVTDFSEAVDDRVAALLVAGANVTLTYDDAANTITVAAAGGGGGGVTDHGALTGLADDDHAQYHTDARALTWLGSRSTADLPEGSNLYHTAARVNTLIAAVVGASVTAAGRALLDDADATAQRATLQLGTAATANAGDFAAASHTHTAAGVTDFAEAVDDRVAALLVQGSGVTLTYNDAANTLTIAATGGGGGTPGGSSGQVQYNNSGAFAGSANLTFNGTSLSVGTNPLKFGASFAITQAGNGFTLTNADNDLFDITFNTSATGANLRYENRSGQLIDDGLPELQFGVVSLASPFRVNRDRVYVTSRTSGIVPLTVKGQSGQSVPVIALDGISSTTTQRRVGSINAAFSDATDASRKGDLFLSSSGFNGDHEGVRLRDSGSGCEVLLAGVRDAADDAAAAALSPAVPVGGLYRTGSALKIRVT